MQGSFIVLKRKWESFFLGELLRSEEVLSAQVLSPSWNGKNLEFPFCFVPLSLHSYPLSRGKACAMTERDGDRHPKKTILLRQAFDNLAQLSLSISSIPSETWTRHGSLIDRHLTMGSEQAANSAECLCYSIRVLLE